MLEPLLIQSKPVSNKKYMVLIQTLQIQIENRIFLNKKQILSVAIFDQEIKKWLF